MPKFKKNPNAMKSPYKMKGHTLPGINQRIDANATNVAEEGLAGSSALQLDVKAIAGAVGGMMGKKKEEDSPAPLKQGSKWHYAAPGPKTSEFFKKARKTGKEMAQKHMAKSGHGTIKDLEAKNLKSNMPKSFNITGSSASDTPGYKDTKMAKAAKVGKKVGKKVAKKVAKAVGGRALGVAGMMMAKTASADQPGTGAHGGKKQTKYNPKSGKYE